MCPGRERAHLPSYLLEEFCRLIQQCLELSYNGHDRQSCPLRFAWGLGRKKRLRYLSHCEVSRSLDMLAVVGEGFDEGDKLGGMSLELS